MARRCFRSCPDRNGWRIFSRKPGAALESRSADVRFLKAQAFLQGLAHPHRHPLAAAYSLARLLRERKYNETHSTFVLSAAARGKVTEIASRSAAPAAFNRPG